MVIGLTQLRHEDNGRKSVPCGFPGYKLRTWRVASCTRHGRRYFGQEPHKRDQINGEMGEGRICAEADQPSVLSP